MRGRMLHLRDPLAADGREVHFRSGRDPGGAAADPRVTGAALEIAGAGAGDGASGHIDLPPERWRALGRRGFRYRDPRASAGVREVRLTRGARRPMLEVDGGGAAWTYALDQRQSGVDVRFILGDEVYCSRFTRFVRNRPGRVLARDAAAPPDCNGHVPAPTCGNHQLESGEDCDDGNTSAGDGCSPTCLDETLPCGNGGLDPGEECDDANRRADDGCSVTCQLEDPSGACAGVSTTSGAALDLALVADGLESPVHVAAPPLDPSRLYVVEQAGRIRVIRDGVLLLTPFLAIAEKVSCCGERGLLSVAFHPAFETNGRFFVYYTDTAGDLVIARYQSTTPDEADPNSEQILLPISHQPYGNHNGGQLAFGPDGYLYAGTGDGGSGGDPQENAQDPRALLGKLLRLDVDVEIPPFYAVPPTNPLVGSGLGREEIWASGLRNPWRFGFDRGTGDLYVADVGQGAWEEVDVQPAASAGGENYGWDVFEGDGHCYEPTPPATECPAPPAGVTMPALEYDHGQGCSITGGFVYRGCALPELRGTYFYSDYCTPFVRTFRGTTGGIAQERADRTADLFPGDGRALDHVVSFGEDARGELYVVDYDGDIFKVVPGR